MKPPAQGRAPLPAGKPQGVQVPFGDGGPLRGLAVRQRPGLFQRLPEHLRIHPLHLSGDIIQTDGFRLFSDKKKLALIRRLAQADTSYPSSSSRRRAVRAASSSRVTRRARTPGRALAPMPSGRSRRLPAFFGQEEAGPDPAAGPGGQGGGAHRLRPGGLPHPSSMGRENRRWFWTPLSYR